MKCNYKVKYKESKSALERIFELFEYDNSDLTFKFILTAMGVLVLAFMFIYGNHGGNTPWGIAVFVLKYILAWAAVFVFAMLLNRTLWAKILQLVAVGSAEQEYEKRVLINKKVIENTLDFYEDHFCNCNELLTEAKVYPYSSVVKILESKNAFGVVVRNESYRFGGPKGMFGFPKESLVDADMEEFKEFLVKRCPNVKHGIKEFNGIFKRKKK